MILQRARDADPLAIGVPGRWRLRLRREDRAAAQQRPCRRVDLGTDIVGAVGDLAPVPVAIAIFVVANLRIGDRDERTEIALTLREQADEPRGDAVGLVVGLGLRGQHDLLAVIVERFGGEELHGAGDAALVLVGGVAFLHAHAVEQLGREQAEIEAAASADVAAIVHAGGRVAEHFHAVQLRAREIRAETAQRDLASLARVAGDGDAGDALQRLGEIHVGERGDVRRHDIVLGPDGATLQILRRQQAAAIAVDDDVRGGLRRFTRERGRLHSGGRNDRRARANSAWRRRCLVPAEDRHAVALDRTQTRPA